MMSAREAVRAIGVLKERGDALEASLNRETGGLNGARDARLTSTTSAGS